MKALIILKRRMKLNRAVDCGVSLIEVYIPKLFVEVEELENYHKASKGKYTIGLGQEKMSVVSEAEDCVSMAMTGSLL